MGYDYQDLSKPIRLFDLDQAIAGADVQSRVNLKAILAGLFDSILREYPISTLLVWNKSGIQLVVATVGIVTV